MKLVVDRASVIPYYAQVKNALQAQIQEGVWRPGDQLPSEPELCRMFDVSRTVIRQALNELVNKGFILRAKGKGTFVAQPKIRESLIQKLTGSYWDLTEQGLIPVTQVLRQEVRPASPDVAAHLQIKSGELVIEIERLRFVHDEPILVVTTYIPYTLCPALLHADLTNQSLYTFLDQQGGVQIAHGRRSIEAIPANEYEAHLLQINEGAPLILLSSVSFMHDNTPIEYYQALHRGDRTRFEVELVRTPTRGDNSELLDLNFDGLPIGEKFIPDN